MHTVLITDYGKREKFAKIERAKSDEFGWLVTWSIYLYHVIFFSAVVILG